MEERELNPFAHADVLHKPLPRDLQVLLERLESGGESSSEPRASEETTGL